MRKLIGIICLTILSACGTFPTSTTQQKFDNMQDCASVPPTEKLSCTAHILRWNSVIQNDPGTIISTETLASNGLCSRLQQTTEYGKCTREAKLSGCEDVPEKFRMRRTSTFTACVSLWEAVKNGSYVGSAGFVIGFGAGVYVAK